MIIVSACLVGVNCKYNSGNNYVKKISKLVEEGKVILVCPEQLGGLPTPRVACEELNGRIVSEDGDDFTFEFERGAEEGLKVALLSKCSKAILKSKSPSCGCGRVYDGTFSKTLVDGDGVFARLLKKNGIEVISSKDFLDEN